MIKRIFTLILVLFAALSFAKGVLNFINIRDDWQFANSLILIQGESPYYSWLHKTDLFRAFITSWQWPTSLPILYILGLPFAWNLTLLMSFYIFSGLFFLILFFYRNTGFNIQSITLISLLVISTSYRNNLGNGQWLFLFFPVGLFFLYDKKISKSLRYILLTLMSTKISIFPFIGLILKRREIIAAILWVFILNIFGFLFLVWISNTEITTNIQIFIKIIKETPNIQTLNNSDLINWQKSKTLYISNIFLIVGSLIHVLKTGNESENSIRMICGLSILNLIGQYSSYDYFLWLIPFMDPKTIDKIEGKVLFFILFAIALESPMRILLKSQEVTEVYIISHLGMLLWLISKLNSNFGYLRRKFNL